MASMETKKKTTKARKITLLFTVALLAVCAIAGIALGRHMTTSNLYTEETASSFWDGVVETADTYAAPDPVELSSIRAVTSGSDIAERIKIIDEASEECTPSPELVEIMKEKYEEAHEKNEDVYAWLYFPRNAELNGLHDEKALKDNEPDFYVDEAIYYDGTTHYLNFNWEHKAKDGGQLFIDVRTKPGESPALLVHGHNMDNDTRFGMLDELVPQENFERDRFFYVYVGGEDTVRVYRTFSCIIFPADEYIPHDYLFSRQEIPDLVEYEDLLDEESMYTCDYLYSEVMSLHTCIRTFKDAHLLVSGYQLNEVTDITSDLIEEHPRLPEIDAAE